MRRRLIRRFGKPAPISLDPRDEMDESEFAACSFIIKIWREEPDADGGPIGWRGHITHVPSGDRRHFEDLREVPRFIVPYLKAIGIESNLPVRSALGARCCRWLHHIR